MKTKLSDTIHAVVLLWALKDRPAWRTRLVSIAVKTFWFITDTGSERELALRWRKPRYRLWVRDEPDGEEFEWTLNINGHFIPICSAKEAERRMQAFLKTHPESFARWERIGG